jgi:hypothetical protein
MPRWVDASGNPANPRDMYECEQDQRVASGGQYVPGNGYIRVDCLKARGYHVE